MADPAEKYAGAQILGQPVTIQTYLPKAASMDAIREEMFAAGLVPATIETLVQLAAQFQYDDDFANAFQLDVTAQRFLDSQDVVSIVALPSAESGNEYGLEMMLESSDDSQPALMATSYLDQGALVLVQSEDYPF